MTVPQQPQNLPPSVWIDLTIQGNVMTSNMITPDVWVNGYRIPTVYGYQQIPMSPGPVHIEAHAQWVRRYGQARLDFPLRPGERVPVFYAAPWHQFTTGSMGHEKQPRNGLGVMLAMIVALLVIIVGLPALALLLA